MVALAKSVSSLLDDPKYTDLEIRCDGKSFRAHRAIVCTRSKVLDKECSGGFMEADTRIIKHDVFGAITMEQMLQFIYRGDYIVKSAERDAAKGTKKLPFAPTPLEDEKGQIYMAQSVTYMPVYRDSSFEELRLEDYEQDNTPLIDALEQHVYTYAIGDYYELPDLKALALERFQSEKGLLLPIKQDKLVRVIDIIYSNTPSGSDDLRKAILTFCVDKEATLLKDGQFAQAIVEAPGLQDFTAEFLQEISRRHQQEHKSHAKIVKTLQTDIAHMSAQMNEDEEIADQQIKAEQALRNSLVAQQLEFRALPMCNYCRAFWNYRLERYGPNGYLARCLMCQSPHYSSHGAI